MSAEIQPRDDRSRPVSPVRILVSVLSTLLFIAILLFATAFVLTPAGQTVLEGLKSLFAADSIQLWWYVTRAAGILAFLLLWFSTVLGLAVKSKFLDRMLDRMFTYDFHEFISLLSIGFLLLHVIVLMLDRYLPYSLGQVLIPFLSPYRPLWVGIGVISAYIIFLVTVTFYLRKKIGQKAYRLIHVVSLLGYLGATLHGIYAGTDTVLPAMKMLYDFTGLVVLFFTVYWLALAIFRKVEAPAAQPPAKAALPKTSTSSRHRYGVR